MAKIAFIGLGVMGFPMAGHLKVRGGHDVTVYNRTTAKAGAWVDQYHGRSAATPADAADEAEFVFACVGNDDDLRAVTVGPQGAFQAMASGSIFVDHTTASAEVARELDVVARERELQFIDAPVSGGQAGAESGQLAVMCGGDERAFERARPLLAAYSKTAKLIGPAGSGQQTKMANQIAIAGLIQGLSEAIAFAEHAGLDVEAVVSIISKGAAQSWQMENRWKTMHAREFDFGFAVDWMRKDLGICLREAERCGAALPVTAMVDSYYSEIQSTGGARYDTSSLILRLKDRKP